MTHEDKGEWEEHHHSGIVHSHQHYHVTHNYNDMVGGFDHMSWQHAHEHDHAEVTHQHYPHRDFEYEHTFEAHTHDHDVPVKRTRREAAEESAADGDAKRRPATRRTTAKAKPTRS